VRRAVVVAAALLAACTSEKPAAEYGEELFNDPRALSISADNPLSCATCHRVTAAPEAGDDRILPGYSLHGVAARARFWGGQSASLLDAVDTCVVYFMKGNKLDRASDEAKALYEYLLSITPAGAPSDPLPFTIVENVKPIPLGDAGRGEDLYRRACANCHGAKGTGEGNILAKKVVLPDVQAEYATIFPGVKPGLVFIELVRHGRFFDVGGTMAPYATEVLSDAELGDILAYLGTPSE
jgi:thiosulfate dehydrogenase